MTHTHGEQRARLAQLVVMEQALCQRLWAPPHQRVAKVERQVNEWTLTELAHTLAMPPPTFYQWLRKGYLQLITHRLTVE